MLPLLPLSAAVLPYLAALGGGFVFDDHTLALGPPGDIWTGGLWGELPAAGYYRPLTSLSFRLDRLLGGGQALAFHAVNLLLHLALVAVSWRLTRRLGAGAGLAALAAALFAMHPTHVEPVAWISARGDLLAALLGLGGWLLLEARRDQPLWAEPARLRPVLAGGLWLAALLAKESAAAIPLMALWSIWLRPGRSAPGTVRRRALSVAAAGAAALAVALAMRLMALGSLRGPLPTDPLENPAAGLAPLDRAATAAVALARALHLLLWPWPLRADYGVPVASAARWGTSLGMAALLLLAGAVAATVLLGLRARRQQPGSPAQLAALGAGATLLAWLPVSSLAPLPGSLLAERYLLLPSWGFTLLAAALLWWRPGSFRRGRTALAGAMLAASLVAVTIRVPQWRDDTTLFTAESKRRPHSYKIDYFTALLAFSGDDDPGALLASGQCLAKAPDFSPCHEVRGRALLRGGQSAQAAEAARRALESSPEVPVLRARYRVLLAESLWQAGQPLAAEALLRTAAAEDTVASTAPRRLGDLLFESARAAEAAAAYRTAVSRSPGDTVAGYNLAMALLESGSGHEAEAVLLRLAGIEGAPAAAFYHLGVLAAEDGRPQDARRLWQEFLEKAGPDLADMAADARRRLQRLPLSSPA